MTRVFRSIGFGFVPAALLGWNAPAPAVSPEWEKLHREAYQQWTRWIASRDEEKRRAAAENLSGFKDEAGTVGLLVSVLADRDDEVRRHAAASLWKLADDEADITAAHAALRARLLDPLPSVRVQAAGALEKSGVDPAELVDARRSVLAQGDWFDVALAARDLIGSVDGAELVDPLLLSLREMPPTRDEDEFDAGDVLTPLVERGGASVLPELMRALNDPALPKVPLLDALGRANPAPAGWRDALLRAARDPEARTRAAAAEQLQALLERGGAGSGWIEPMLPLLQDRYAEVREAVCDLFAEARGDAHPAVDGLVALLRTEPEADVRRSAVRALAAIGNITESYDRAVKASVGSKARPVLEAIAANPNEDEDTREDAQAALKALAEGTATGTKVLTATQPGNAAALQRLRERGVEFTEDSFWRALNERDVQTVTDLLDAGISPRSLDAGGMPPLHMVLMSGCDYGQPTATETQQIIAALLQRGADPNQRDKNGDNPALHRASSCDAKVIKQLIAAKADLRARNGTQISAFPLFLVTSPGAAGALLDAGYRADAKDRGMLQGMLAGEKDPTKRKLIQRALGQ